MELGIDEIKKIIPQRYPFLMVDKVVELEPNEKLVAVKNVSINEHFFVGHFPQEKVMPGVLIIEAMAQAACVYFYYSQKKMGKNLIFYLGETKIKFLKSVMPGDQLQLEIKSVQLIEKMGYVGAKAFVKPDLIAEGEIIFSVKEANE